MERKINVPNNVQKIYTRSKLRIPKMEMKFNRKYENNKNKKDLQKISKIVIVLTIAFLVVHFSLKAINPILDAQCKNMAKSVATKVSNEQATIAMEGYQYEDLLKITKDQNGSIQMVETNIITVNKIVSDIPIKMQEALEKDGNKEFNIRLGSFLGNNLFAGRGPEIPIKMETIGNVETTLYSDFESAGINQTFHKVYLEIKCNVLILTPYHTIEEQIVNQVLLAQGLIVGDVPASYYNLEGMTRENAVDVVE